MSELERLLPTLKTVLFFTAHPDDVIVFFGGLIATLVEQGAQVHVVLATNGARGSRETQVSETTLAQTRFAEETAALEVLGVPSSHLYSLNYLDGEMESTMELIAKVSCYIRRLKPDLVCTHEPGKQVVFEPGTGYFIQHRDHRKIGEAVIDAVYPFSRDLSFFPEHATAGFTPHTVTKLLLTDEVESNTTLIVTEKREKKRAAMLKHVTQFDEQKVDAILQFFMEGDELVEKFRYVSLSW